jgi:diacylglycerol kinase family enzyme
MAYHRPYILKTLRNEVFLFVMMSVMTEITQRVLVITNPSSSRAKEVKEHVLDPLTKATPNGMEIVIFSITSKDRVVTARQIAAVIKPHDRIIVAGGDGTGNVTVNAILQTDDSTGVCIGFLPYGNFNDMASTFTDRLVKENPLVLLTAPSVVTAHPLDIRINKQHYQYGLLYATVGWTAFAAAEFDMPRKREDLQDGQAHLLVNLFHVAKMYFKTRRSSYIPRFQRPGHELKPHTTDILAINGPIMAKIIKSQRALYETRSFLSKDLDVSKFYTNRALLSRSALNYLFRTRLSLPGVERTKDIIEFESPADFPLQIDGEVSLLSDVTSLTISKDQSPNAQTISVIKTSK